MSQISAAQVRRLREKTDMPMMDCKSALVEAGGDEEKAFEILQSKAKGKLVAKADRETAEGRIGFFVDSANGIGGLVEIRCETAPVAKNEMFVTLANQIAEHVARGNEESPDPAAILTQEVAGTGKTAGDLIADAFGKLRENMQLKRCRRVAGPALGGYVHHDGTVGVICVADKAPTNPDVLKDVCQHICALKPAALNREGVPADQVDAQRSSIAEEALATGKPANIIEKIVNGKLNAWFAECVLLEQPHVKDLEKKRTVKKVLAEDGNVQCTGFVRFAVGEIVSDQ
jgi:elongation factor Ts